MNSPHVTRAPGAAVAALLALTASVPTGRAQPEAHDPAPSGEAELAPARPPPEGSPSEPQSAEEPAPEPQSAEEPAPEPQSAEEVDALTRELAEELGAQGEGAPDAPSASAATAARSTSSAPDGSVSGTDLGRMLLLPDISALFTAGLFYFSDVPTPRFPAHEPNHDREGFRFQLQELELALQSAIDPYVRADLFLALTLTSIEVEEAYMTTLSLPANLQARLGFMYACFGRFNTRHFLEVEPFVDMPLVNRRFFGGEQLKGLGVEVSWLAPLPWYVEAKFEVLTAQNELSFGVPMTETSAVTDFLVVGHLQQFFDLTEAWSLQWGLSVAHGPNDTGDAWLRDENRTTLLGTDLYLRWRDPGSLRYVAWQTEYIARRALLVGLDDEVPVGSRLWEGGLYSHVSWRLSRNWEVALRFDWFGMPSELASDDLGFSGALLPWHRPTEQWRTGAALSFYASEFHRWRLQYNLDVQRGNEDRFEEGAAARVAHRDPVHELFLQYQFILGSHGAHPF